MRVLFLDMDGVLNSHDTYKRVERGEYTWPQMDFVGAAKPWRLHVDVAAVGRLNKIGDGFSIVVSSAWRSIGLAKMRALLRAVGVRAPVVAVTPDLTFGNAGSPIVLAKTRADEIRAWLASTKRKVERFAIVDDDTDAGLGFADHYVRTHFTAQPNGGPGGLQDHHVERIREILGLSATERAA